MTNSCKLMPYGETGTPNYLKKAEKLYLEAFPPEERRPWTDIAKPQSCKGPQLLFITQGNEDCFAGFVTLWQFENFVYVEHFAIDSAARGNGTGTKVLGLLKASTLLPIVLEVEPISDSNPMAERRIAFYQRNGFSLLEYDYIQPPYQPQLPSVHLRLMSTLSNIDPKEVEQTLRREVYGMKGICMKIRR